MKSPLFLVFSLLTGVLSVSLFSAPDAAAHGTHGSLSAGYTPVLLSQRNQPGWTMDCPDGTPGFWFEDRTGNVECYSVGDGLSSDEEIPAVIAKSREIESQFCFSGEEMDGGGFFMEYPAKCVLEDHTDIALRDDCYGQSRIAHIHPGRDLPAIHFHSWRDDTGCGHSARAVDPAPPFEFVVPATPPLRDPEPAPVEPPAATPPVSVSAGNPLVRTPVAIQSPAEPAANVVSELGIQSGSYAPVSAQRPPQSADSGSAAALGLAALPVALLAGWHILSPDEWSAPSFGFSGVLTDASSDAIGRMSAQRGSWSAYADAHLSRGATTEYVGGAEYRASRWLSFTYAAHAREGKSDADLVFGAVADRRFGRWHFTAGADTDVGARAQAVLSLGR